MWLSPHDRPLTEDELHEAVACAHAVVTMLHDRVDGTFCMLPGSSCAAWPMWPSATTTSTWPPAQPGVIVTKRRGADRGDRRPGLGAHPDGHPPPGRGASASCARASRGPGTCSSCWGRVQGKRLGIWAWARSARRRPPWSCVWDGDRVPGRRPAPRARGRPNGGGSRSRSCSRPRSRLAPQSPHARDQGTHRRPAWHGCARRLPRQHHPGADRGRGRAGPSVGTGEIAGAGLDVFEQEPEVHPGPPLHNAVPAASWAATIETRTAMAMLAAENAIAVSSGARLRRPRSSRATLRAQCSLPGACRRRGQVGHLRAARVVGDRLEVDLHQTPGGHTRRLGQQRAGDRVAQWLRVPESRPPAPAPHNPRPRARSQAASPRHSTARRQPRLTVRLARGQAERVEHGLVSGQLALGQLDQPRAERRSAATSSSGVHVGVVLAPEREPAAISTSARCRCRRERGGGPAPGRGRPCGERVEQPDPGMATVARRMPWLAGGRRSEQPDRPAVGVDVDVERGRRLAEPRHLLDVAAQRDEPAGAGVGADVADRQA